MSTTTTIEVQTDGHKSTLHQTPISKQEATAVKQQFEKERPAFEDKYEERVYLKGRLAAAFRIFGRKGFDEGVAGHITLRDPVDPTTFWVNPFGVAFSLLKASDLIQVDHAGNVIGGGENRLLNAAAFMIHAAIHAARPDVDCAAHSHSIHGKAFCALGKEIDMISQDACAFYNVSQSPCFMPPLFCDLQSNNANSYVIQDNVVYGPFGGVVLAEQEGKEIAQALGSHKAALLQNHGLLTVGKTVEEAVFWFILLERCCQAQLMADAAGTTVKIDEADAAFTCKQIGSHEAGRFSGKPLFDVIHEETGGRYLN